MKKLMVAASAALMGFAANAVTVYMAPNGDDANDGSAAKPVKNLSRAVELVRAVTNATARKIVVKDGRYRIEPKPVALTDKDSELVIEAEHPGKAVFSGAERVTGWQVDPDDSRFLTAKAPFEIQPMMRYVFTVKGECMDLATFPGAGYTERLTYFTDSMDIARNNRTEIRYDERMLPAGCDFRDLDLDSAWVTVPQEWATTRSYIATNDWRHATFSLKTPTHMTLGNYNLGCQVANCRLGMKAPGAWMYERTKGRLIYWPKEGETAATLARDAELSQSVGFLVAAMTRNLVVRGLVIESLSAPVANTPAGMPEPLALAIRWNAHTSDISGIRIENCEVRNTAGTGISFHQVNGATAVGCHVHHAQRRGIEFLSSTFGNAALSNTIHHIGDTAIMGQSRQSHYDFNHVYEVDCAGVTLWSSHMTFNSNHVHHTMKVRRDGGGLYGGYMFSELIGNWTHDNGDWPGLYNDEGGQRCVFAQNRFGDWWPFHMHDCYGIVVTNNVFECDDAMRFSFQGSCHCVFKDNVIRTRQPITEDPFVACCDAWDNALELKQPDGSYKPAGRVAFPKVPLAAKEPYPAYPSLGCCTNGNAQFMSWMIVPETKYCAIDRLPDGRQAHGVPGATFMLAYDSTNLYYHGWYNYNKLTPYPGSKHHGEDLEKDDSIKFHFQGYSVTLLVKGVAIDSKGWRYPKCQSGRAGGLGDGDYWMSLTIPWEKIGCKFKTATDMFGKEIPFNVEFVNIDHGERRFYSQPVGGNLLTGRLTFGPAPKPNYTTFPNQQRVDAADGQCRPGAVAPFGKVQHDLETALRATDEYAAGIGYIERNTALMGHVLSDRAASPDSFGHRAFLLQPFAGEDPAPGGRSCQRMSVRGGPAGVFRLSTQNWNSMTDACATENAVHYSFQYPRGGRYKVLVDGNYADGEGEVVESEMTLENGVLTAHNRVKTGWFGKGYDVWAKMSFSPAPVAVRQFPCAGKGRRLLLEFDLKPISGAVIVTATVSEKSAADAEARFAAAPKSSDYEQLRKASVDLWHDQLAANCLPGHLHVQKDFVTAIYGAFSQPVGKPFSVRCGLDTLKVTAKGAVEKGCKLKSATFKGEPLPKDLPRYFFKGGGDLELVFEPAVPAAE